jgi:uncharacterized repeat protein (TIGR03803 family)
MRNLARFALNIGAAALLAGCGGSQPPIGVPGAMPQAPQIASRASSAYNVLYRFTRQIDGYYPVAPLIDANGTLYGTAEKGGGRGKCLGSTCGTVYSVSTSGAEKVLHSFGSDPDGAIPEAGLVDVHGTLYGTTAAGGFGWGTVFSISTSGSEQVLYKFHAIPDGHYPKAALIYANGLLYGTTSAGGSSGSGCQSDGCGTVFTVSLSGKETVLYRFAGGKYDGAEPVSNLIDVNGTFYGTTRAGGAPISSHYCCGTVYSMSKSGKETVLYIFQGGTDGFFPYAGLINVNGTLYGSTAAGGHCDPGCGTVYSITPQGKERVLYRFGCCTSPSGLVPVAGLIAVNGTLYGTTEGAKCGTIYSVSTSGAEQVLHNFTGGTDGCFPQAALINVHGTLYGTTSSAYKRHRGPAGPGTIFALTL